MGLLGLIAKLGLFFAAYAPLSLIFAIRSVERGKWHWGLLWPGFTIWLLIAIIGFCSLFGFLRSFKHLNAIEVTVRDVQDLGPEVAAYTATYLLPFVAPTLSGWRDIASYAMYFAILFVIFIKSDLQLINPTLYIFHRRLSRVRLVAIDEDNIETEIDNDALIVTLDKLKERKTITTVSVAGIYIEKRQKA